MFPHIYSKPGSTSSKQEPLFTTKNTSPRTRITFSRSDTASTCSLYSESSSSRSGASSPNTCTGYNETTLCKYASESRVLAGLRTSIYNADTHERN